MSVRRKHRHVSVLSRWKEIDVERILDDIETWLNTPAFGNIKVVWDEHAVDCKRVARSWRERLFTRPWRPRRRWKIVKEPKMFWVQDRAMLVAHPDLKVNVEAAIRAIAEEKDDDGRDCYLAGDVGFVYRGAVLQNQG